MSTNYILKNFKNLEHARIPCKCTNHYCYFNALFCGLQGSHSGHHVVVFSTTIFVVSVYDDDEENGKGKK